MRKLRAGMNTGWSGVLLALLVAGCGGGSEAPVETARAAPQEASVSATAREMPAAAADTGVAPVYRFAKISNGAYFYTGSEEERSIILNTYPDFRFEGIAFNRTADDAGQPVYRFANLVNGGYFYTADEAEKQLVIDTRTDMRFEGSTFKVAGAAHANPEPVYRLANLRNGAYLYTRSKEESDAAAATTIWRPEGVVFKAPLGNAVVPTTITATGLTYGKQALISVTGINVDLGAALTVDNKCSGLAEVPGGTVQIRMFRCRIVGTGGLNAELRASGQLVASGVLTVPEPQVTVATSRGTIVMELNPTKAPITVDNFLRYVNEGFYSNILFHRVINNFVIQAGGFQPNMVVKPPTYVPIKLESTNGLSNLRGTIAMARTQAPDSASSQFFINVANNTSLNYQSATSPGYAVFGTVVQGMDVVDAIRVVPTGTVAGQADVPLTEVLLQSAVQTR